MTRATDNHPRKTGAMPGKPHTLGRVYPDLVRYCAQPRTGQDVAAWAATQGLQSSNDNSRRFLDRCEEAGAMRRAGMSPTGGHRYMATGRAMDPLVITQLLGADAARAMGHTIHDTAPARPQAALEARPQVQPVAAPPAEALGPLVLFQAEFRTDGVRIPYDQLPNLVAMLDAITNREG